MLGDTPSDVACAAWTLRMAPGSIDAPLGASAAAACPGAALADVTFATVSHPTPVSFFRDRLAWSAFDQARNGYVLMTHHGGVTSAVPVRRAGCPVRRRPRPRRAGRHGRRLLALWTGAELLAAGVRTPAMEQRPGLQRVPVQLRHRPRDARRERQHRRQLGVPAFDLGDPDRICARLRERPRTGR